MLRAGTVKRSAASDELNLPAGVVLPFAGASAPSGWLLAYGQAVSRTTYADLFAVIGTTYGSGDGSTTFNLPDYRGRVAAGKDNMGGSSALRLTSAGSGVDGSTLGVTGGAQSHTLTVNQIPAHSHDVITRDGGGGLNGNRPVGSNLGATSGSNNTDAAASKGGGEAHNNVQPSIVQNYIIKT